MKLRLMQQLFLEESKRLATPIQHWVGNRERYIDLEALIPQ